MLPAMGNSVFTKEEIVKHPQWWEALIKLIPDYIMTPAFWTPTADGIEFHDSQGKLSFLWEDRIHQ